MHPLFFSILLPILSIAFKAHSVDDSVPYLTYCYGTNFTSTSPYASHLRSLLSDLVDSTPNSPSFFSTINSSSLPIFGLAQCRPGISAAECDACLSNSAAAAGSNPPGGCGHQRTGSLRSSNCLLRYSEQLFFGIVEDNIVVYSDNSALQNASDSFNREVQVLMKAVMASASSAPKRFGTGIANDSVEERDIYGMGWCSMDLASSDCSECLGLLMGTMPARKTRGFIGTVSCALRFETFQFFSSSAIVTPSSAPVAAAEKWSKNKKIIIFAGPSGAVALLLLFAFFVLLLGRRKRSLAGSKIRDDVGEEMLINAEVQVFDISVIKNATNNYAIDNKLGQGGFGPVYKGVLPNGQEIAVKRLSTTSGQGLAEMTNEINFLAKLQHKNLVRLLGYCLEGEEKLLVYEFLPNTSLDKFLFDPDRRMQLDWETRFKIIVGIGRGILYLHEDSSLKIIHRDLKVSNILLDSNMNPKISDFGLAKLFGVDETERNTVKIAGTLEYMAPEYILHGLFSTKSDVFSYGVLLLEIITGEKKGTNGLEDAVDLLSYVWQQWRNRKALQVIDKSIGDRYPVQEAMRCIQIGLLCVQEEQIQRPNMASVTTMLSTSSMKLPTPSAPAFYVEPSKSVSVQESMSRIRDIDLELPVMSSMKSQDVRPGLGR